MARTDDRLADLEARVAGLEARVGAAVRPPAADGRPGAGVLSYRGEVRLDGPVQWQINYDVDAVLALPAPSTVEVLTAVGHPLRLALVRRLLRGPATAADLQAELAVNSTGKLYHHLRTLVAARVVVSTEQTYAVPAGAVVPVLVLMLAAGDVSGSVGQPDG